MNIEIESIKLTAGRRALMDEVKNRAHNIAHNCYHPDDGPDVKKLAVEILDFHGAIEDMDTDLAKDGWRWAPYQGHYVK